MSEASVSNSGLSSSSLRFRAADDDQQIVKKMSEERENLENDATKVFSDAWNLCHLTELPLWLKLNDHLLIGHRPPLFSFKACFQSAFQLHNETGNIWTHAFGCLLFLFLVVYVFFCSQYSSNSLVDKMVLGSFFAGTIMCFGLSAFYHTLGCHSHSAKRLFFKLDCCGILLKIMGSFIPWFYYTFYCSLMPKIFYLCLTIFLGTFSLIVALWDRFSGPHLSHVRAGVFFSFGSSAFIPIILWHITHGLTSGFEASIRSSFTSLTLMGVFYTIGVILHVSQIPERFYPGKCDYWFHSHQLFHTLAVLGSIFNYRGIISMADYRLNSPEGVCEVGEQYYEY